MGIVYDLRKIFDKKFREEEHHREKLNNIMNYVCTIAGYRLSENLIKQKKKKGGSKQC